MENFGYDIEKIKRVAMERGWTRSKLAHFAGVTSPTVCTLFRGERVTETTIAKVADALGLELAKLVVSKRQATGNREQATGNGKRQKTTRVNRKSKGVPA